MFNTSSRQVTGQSAERAAGQAAEKGAAQAAGPDAAQAAGPATARRRAAISGYARSHPVSLGVFSLLIAYAIIVPIVASAGDASFSYALKPPSGQHWFGTDHFGFDLFVRTAQSLRVSLMIGLISAAISTALGVWIGLVAAASGGMVDRIIMRLNDAVNSIPHLILTVVVVALFKGSLVAIIASIALTHWSPVARIVRSTVLSVRTSEVVECSYGAGASFGWVLRKHLAPAAFGQALVAMVMLVPHAVWHESALSFLGLGIQANEPSLGTLMDLAREDIIRGAWWTLLFPALVLLSTTLSGVSLARSARGSAIPSVSAVASSPKGKAAKGKGLAGSGKARRGLDIAVDAESRAGNQAVSGDDVPAVDEQLSEGIGLKNWSVQVDGHYLVRDISLHLKQGELYGLIGTSGSGKTTVGHGLIGVVPAGSDVSGSVTGIAYGGRADAARSWDPVVLKGLRGQCVGFVPQSAARSFTPVRRIGSQLQELIDQHSAGATQRKAHESHGGGQGAEHHDGGRKREVPTVERLLSQVHLGADVAEMFPHQLSGGMAQRVAVAAALAGNPEFVIADEPTSALDPELTQEIMQLFKSLTTELGVGVLLISHDLEDLRELDICDRMAVMNEGEIVESGPAHQVLHHTQDAFTTQLLAALPSGGLQWDDAASQGSKEDDVQRGETR